MTLHPDIIDAMIAAGAALAVDPGAVLAMVAAVHRAAWNSQGVEPTGNEGESAAGHILGAANDRPLSPPCNAATLHATRRNADATKSPKTSTERSRECRARQREKARSAVQRQNVASVAPSPSLSLVENIDSSKEREAKVQRCNVACNAGVAPLPDDWQPDGKSWGVVVEALGEASALVLAANFRDHYLARPQDQRTPAAWQATLRKWARQERGRLNGSAQLPLMRKVAAGQARDDPSGRWKLERAYQETMARRRESG